MQMLFKVIVLAALCTLTGCGYNTFQTGEEQIKASWSEVVNQYQRRADLIPNLVNVVKGEAKFEQDTLTQVIDARSRALSRLMAVSENYPNLKANQAFRDLQAQLEGTENRITVARNRYIQSVQAYNVTVRSFPSNLTAIVMGYLQKPNFTVDNEKEIARPPSVNFDTTPARPAVNASGPAQ